MAVSYNKIREGFGLAKTVAVNGMGKVVVHDVSFKNKGSSVTDRNQFHDGGKAAGGHDIFKVQTNAVEKMAGDLPGSLFRRHLKDQFIFQKFGV